MLKTKKYFFFQFSGEIIDHKSMQPVETRLLRYFIADRLGYRELKSMLNLCPCIFLYYVKSVHGIVAP